MSRFISLSSTNKIVGMMYISYRFQFCLTLGFLGAWYRRRRMWTVDSRRASHAVFFNQHGKAVTVDGFNEITGGSQIKSHGFIVNNGHDNDRDVRQSRIALEFFEHRPAVEFRHDYI